MRKVYERVLAIVFNILGLMIGKMMVLTNVSDAIKYSFIMNLFEHSRAKGTSILDVFSAVNTDVILANNGIDLEGDADLNSIINFSSNWRNEWVIRKSAEISAGAHVLDAGAGECQYRKFFSHTEYFSQDFACYEGTEEGSQKEEWRYGKIDYVCDITKIPVPDHSFDVVLCTEVLEHVADPIATLKELTRILRPGGKLLLSAPLGCGLHQQPYHYYGGFTPHFYKNYLSRFGVTVTEITPLGGLLRHVAQECHRVGRVISENKNMGPEKSILESLMNEMPRILSSLDEKYFVEEFTVGYLVEAQKNPLALSNSSSVVNSKESAINE